MKPRRVATYILGAFFIALAVAAVLTGSPWLFGLAVVFQIAMFLPQWGGRE